MRPSTRLLTVGLANLTAMLSACTDPVPTAASASATSTVPRAELVSPTAETGPCPPTSLPTGYVLHYCFNFTTPVDGVWHGFIVERSVAQPPETVNGAYTRTRLNWDYLLVTPTGYRRFEAADGIAPSAAADLTTFQAEYNGREWFDVLRVMRGIGTRTGPMTIAVAKRARTFRSRTTDLIRAVTSLRIDNVLTSPEALNLMQPLRQAIELQDAGDNATASVRLGNFIGRVVAYRNRTPPLLTAAQGDALIAGAREIQAQLAP
jgi:hypothetical protein